MTIWMPILDDRAERPLYLAIARAIEADVCSGTLGPGERLPAHRDLADRLGVNVGTVSRAYAECERGGWIRGEVGRGTFVHGADTPRARDPFGRADAPAAEGTIDLSLNVPADAPKPDVAAALRRLAAEPGAADLLHYGPSEGGPRDRAAGAQALARQGLEVEPASVVLCAGAQHGLSVCLAAACRPGEVVAVEALSYPGFRAAAEARGLRVAPVAMDRAGLLPEAFEEVCASSRPRALYLSPTLQNPTTSTLSSARRERIAEIAAGNDVIVIEDDIHRMLAHGAAPPVSSFVPHASLYIASLSKCLAPGLRIGYLAVPGALRQRVVEQVWASIWSVSPLAAALATRWIEDGTFERIAAGSRSEAARRQELAAEALGSLPEGFRAVSAPTAYHVWLELGGDWNATAFANAVRERGALVTPADAFFQGRGAPPRAVRISLSAAPDRATLARGLDRIREAAAGGGRGGWPTVRL